MRSLVESIIAEEALRGNFPDHIEVREGASFEGVMCYAPTLGIAIRYDPDYAQKSSSLAKSFPEREEQLLRSLVRHEINHKGYANIPGCPGNLEMYFTLLERISKVLKQHKFPNVPVGSQGHTLYTYMANLFTDFIDNTQLGMTMDHTGMFLNYKYNIGGEDFPPLFDAFVCLQEYSYGRKQTKILLRENHCAEPKVRDAVKNIIKDAALKRTEKGEFFFSEQWPDFAELFTKHMLPLIDKSKLKDSAYIQIHFPAFDGFPEELKDPETQMDLVWKRYLQGENTSNSFVPPAFLDDFLSLKLLYTRLARNLEIRTRASTKEEALPVTKYGRKAFDPLQDSFARARLSFDRGNLELLAQRYALEIPVAYHERPHNLPEIRLAFLDTSSSTKERVHAKEHARVVNPWAVADMQWTDDSIYHYELLSWFGLVEFLKKQGALRKTSVHLANFSNQTQYAENLDDSYKLALSPQFGATFLNVERIFAKIKKALTISITDGDVANWPQIRKDYIHSAKEQYYFHIQVGKETAMSSDLKAAGIPVFYDNGKNLGRMLIDLTRPFVTEDKK